MKRFSQVIIYLLLITSLAACGYRVPEQVANTQYANYEDAIAGEAQSRGITLSQGELRDIGLMAEADAAEYQLAGVTLTQEQQAALLEAYKTEALAEKLCDLLITDVSVPEENVRKWYDERLAALQKAFAEDPGMFKGQQEGYELYGGVPPLIVPEGYIHVKHILVEDEETAQAVLSRVREGSSFDTLLAEYGTDSGMKAAPYTIVGYLVGPYESERDYFPEFKKAALALENEGDVSGVVKTEAGYHVIQLLNRMTAKTVQYEEAAKTIRALLEKQARQAAFEELVSGWYKQQ